MLLNNQTLLIIMLCYLLATTIHKLDKSIKERDRIFKRAIELGSQLEILTGKMVYITDIYEPVKVNKIKKAWKWLVKLALTPVEDLWRRK